MALEGTLSDFNLSNIFLLIDQDQKDGILKVDSEQKVDIVFKNGQIIYIRSNREDIKTFLYRFLTQVKGYSEKEMEELNTLYYNNYHLLSEELIKKGYLTVNELTTIMQTGIIDIACAVFTLEGGKYRFEPQPTVVRYQFSNIVVPTNFIMLEAAKRADEWVTISEVITEETLFGNNRALSPRDIHQPLNNFREYVISFVNGRRTVQDICDCVFFSSFHVYTAIDEALRQGDITLLSKPDKSPLPSQIKKTPHHKEDASFWENGKSIIAASTTAVLLLVLLLVGIHYTNTEKMHAHRTQAYHLLQQNRIRERDLRIQTGKIVLKSTGDVVSPKKLQTTGIIERNEKQYVEE
ncbi:DUF4388 domain-containing protein [Chitinivibrio alkaliphilus]|uniref:PatA-like N-terminal domain-containing protein n=1 Tax=Chitinivibrio alkaliphilus ACht1 TaxID=1313304 RepID=U7DAQ1_9BACT|nr:DUF4388 domain-containing protein [Chitinivibrio alkaliphilus]ERP31475.1 hypothetical protein CALK_1679 [Chitinivibrio alkaliphilus ACht1]